MAAISVSTIIPRPVTEVWAEVERIEDHVEWMADAHSLEFLSDSRRGVGTRIEVETRVGPLRTTDVMEFTEWEPERAMGVVHRGLIGGTGRFELSEVAGGTRFTWTEQLEFPWYLGGRLGAWFAKPVLRWVWRRNLDALAARFR